MSQPPHSQSISNAGPLPGLAFRLGVVGKRIDGYLKAGALIPKNVDGVPVDCGKIKAKLTEVFECVRLAVEVGASNLEDAVENKARLRIISSLAPGVDQMAGEWAAAEKQNSEEKVDVSLELILPAAWDAYAMSIWESSKKEADKRGQTTHLIQSDLDPLQKIIDSADGVLELDGRIAYRRDAAIKMGLDSNAPEIWSAKRLHAYRANAWFVAEQADVLVAVFDPHAPAALAGTAEAVRLAVIKGLPVVAINLYNPDDVGILTNHVEFLQWGTFHADSTNPPPWKAQLTKLAQQILLPWEPDAKAEASMKIANELKKILKSTGEVRRLSHRIGRFLDFHLQCLDWFASLFAPPPGGVRNGPLLSPIIKFFKSAKARLLRHSKEDPKSDSKTDLSQEDSSIDIRRKNFRDLANAYRGGFRFSYLLKSLLAFGVIVWLALYNHFPDWRLGVAIAETVFLLLIFLTVRLCDHRRWGANQFDCRVVTELIKQVLALKDTHVSLGRPVASLVDTDLKHAPSWVMWLPRHLMRSRQFQQRKIIKAEDVRTAYESLRKEIDVQIGYHNRKSVQQEKITKHLSFLANFSFAISLLIAIAHLVSLCFVYTESNASTPELPLLKDGGRTWQWLHENGRTWLAIFAAIASAAASYKNHSDCERLALRSSLMEGLFNKLKARVEALQGDQMDFLAIAQLSSETANHIVEEALDWRSLQTHRKVGLP